MTIYDILDKIKAEAVGTTDQGTQFERLVRAYLKTEPAHQKMYSDVWLWKDWPQREGLGFSAQDIGIDIVAKLRHEDTYCAIQCKHQDAKVTLKDLGTFFASSNTKYFSNRIAFLTSGITDNLKETNAKNNVPLQICTAHDLAESSIDWSKFKFSKPEDLKVRDAKSAYPHQKAAVKDVLKGFESHDRGKLVMACGTGKTFTSLLIAKEVASSDGVVLVLMPSIALISQMLHEWANDFPNNPAFFAVCSDVSVGESIKSASKKSDLGKEDLAEVISSIGVDQFPFPATTSGERLAAQLSHSKAGGGRKIIFSTYHSIATIKDAQDRLGFEIDLIVCDEAHRTTGYTLAEHDESAFVKVHDPKYLKAKKRLYMTATPRIYDEQSKRKAKSADVEVCSMDDEKLFGPLFHRLSFQEAVEKELLTDYKVMVMAVDELYVRREFGDLIGEGHEKDKLDWDDATKIVGIWHAIGKRFSEEDQASKAHDPEPMRTAIAFADRIATSKHLAGDPNNPSRIGKIMEVVQQRHPFDPELPTLTTAHVDGTMSMADRSKEISVLREFAKGKQENACHILSNARCLSEGVDVPALDAVIFLNPRSSVVDVVQSVGRVMRKPSDPTIKKKYGYVILPIPVRVDQDPAAALDNNERYKVIWQVLRALRSHDDRLDRQFATIDLQGKSNGVVEVNLIGGGGAEEPKPNNEGGAEREKGQDSKDELIRQVEGSLFYHQMLENLQTAIFAKIVKKCGDSEYWEDWAYKVKELAELHTKRIADTVSKKDSKPAKAFARFVEGLQKNINPQIDDEQAVDMLAQHLITRPIFEALFRDYSFADSNPVSQAMQGVMDVVDSITLEADRKILKDFYKSVQDRISSIDTPKGRQDLIRKLYDRFFKVAFPKLAERLGIVYTPVEVVDFILKSADEALREHLGVSIADEGVHVLDPFTGTGTFPVRLIESGLIPKEKLKHKYLKELHANEIVLLAYYIAAINIEEAFHRTSGEPYSSFEGIVLTDTFQLGEGEGQFSETTPKNSERIENQKSRDIRVIVANPPYSVGQESGNDNNQNLKYPALDAQIAGTYAARSTSTLKNSLYDSYIRAFRWASDRIGESGVICMVTNGGWLDGNTMDGFRETLQIEFAEIYVYNLRGNQRTSGEKSRQEGGKIFGSGSRTPVTITLLVKKAGHKGKAKIHYRDIGDYLSREEKLELVEGAQSFKGLELSTIKPNKYQDWIDQRSERMEELYPLTGNDRRRLFEVRANGIKTNRDTWIYSFGVKRLRSQISQIVSFYREELSKYRERYDAAVDRDSEDPTTEARKGVSSDPAKIKWTRALKKRLEDQKDLSERTVERESIYRPFCKQHCHYNRDLIEVFPTKLGPTAHHENVVIDVNGTGMEKDFSCLICNRLPDVQCLGNGQCFPLYRYSKPTKEGQRLAFEESIDEQGFTREDGVTNEALVDFRSHYADDSIGKEDIFYYVYGVLHNESYREEFKHNFRRELPRIPFAKDFWAYSKAGRELAEWHLNYESVEPWPCKVTYPEGLLQLDAYEFHAVEKMRHPKKGVLDTIIYNDRIRVSEIPLEAYQYVVNGKSAIEWIIERYQVSTDSKSGITNDPNDWSREHEKPTYILDLLLRVIRVSMETNRIVAKLPDLE